MPLLPGIEPNLAATPAEKAQAIATGRALIKAMYGERFGDAPSFSGISEGLQNFNGFISDPQGNRLAFLSILRCGQGEIATYDHQKQVLENVAKLADAGFSTPNIIRGKAGELLVPIPRDLQLDGQPIDLPRDVKASTYAVCYTYIRGTPLPNPVQNLEQAHTMGRLHGQYFNVGARIFDDIGRLENPVSFTRLEALFRQGLGLSASQSIALAQSRLVDILEGRAAQEEAYLAQCPLPKTELAPRIHSLQLVKTFSRTLAQSNWAEGILAQFAQARELWQHQQFDQLPDARINGDFHSGNMFAEGVMFDMGWMGDGKRLFDLCQAIAISCSKDGLFWEQAATAYMHGVTEEITLTPEETAAAPLMLWITYLRSLTTRFISIVESAETQFVTKSPLELEQRRSHYFETVIQQKRNWAEAR